MDPELVKVLRANPAQMKALDRLANKHGQSIQVFLMPPGGILPKDCVGVRWPDGTPLAAIGVTGRIMRLDRDT